MEDQAREKALSCAASLLAVTGGQLSWDHVGPLPALLRLLTRPYGPELDTLPLLATSLN